MFIVYEKGRVFGEGFVGMFKTERTAQAYINDIHDVNPNLEDDTFKIVKLDDAINSAVLNAIVNLEIKKDEESIHIKFTNKDATIY